MKQFKLLLLRGCLWQIVLLFSVAFSSEINPSCKHCILEWISLCTNLCDYLRGLLMYRLLVNSYIMSATFYSLPLPILAPGVNYSKAYCFSRARIFFPSLFLCLNIIGPYPMFRAAHVLFHLDKNQVKINDKMIIL